MRIVAVGECMAELTRTDASTMTLGFAGDTFNTAVYLKRLAGADMEVRFLTAVGDDALTSEQLAFMHSEGITVDAQRVPGASPALYIVTTDAAGERTFTYYRHASPVRHLLDGDIDEGARAPAASCGCRSRVLLGDHPADADRRGPQYHCCSWRPMPARGAPSSPSTATTGQEDGRRPMRRGGRSLRPRHVTDIALPSLSDEQLLHGGGADDVIDTLSFRWRARGRREGRAAATSSIWKAQRRRFTPIADTRPIDTTGAGDSFNAGYLHARLQSRSVEDAIAQACAVSSIVVAHRGAIVGRDVELLR